ncbi:MAG: hypothetical protein DRO76_04700 [Candidatus Altiarchaeales archaeon]|nr:MAG: hypothetical protein DRO76_04700 [Candidatus Altiarchaeales archaeon]
MSLSDVPTELRKELFKDVSGDTRVESISIGRNIRMEFKGARTNLIVKILDADRLEVKIGGRVIYKVSGYRAREIIRGFGIIGVTQDRWKNVVLLNRKNLDEIKSRQGKPFKDLFGVKKSEGIRRIILRSIEESITTLSGKIDRFGEPVTTIYTAEIDGVWVKTEVNKNGLITGCSLSKSTEKETGSGRSTNVEDKENYVIQRTKSHGDPSNEKPKKGQSRISTNKIKEAQIKTESKRDEYASQTGNIISSASGIVTNGKIEWAKERIKKHLNSSKDSDKGNVDATVSPEILERVTELQRSILELDPTEVPLSPWDIRNIEEFIGLTKNFASISGLDPNIGNEFSSSKPDSQKPDTLDSDSTNSIENMKITEEELRLILYSLDGNPWHLVKPLPPEAIGDDGFIKPTEGNLSAISAFLGGFYGNLPEIVESIIDEELKEEYREVAESLKEKIDLLPMYLEEDSRNHDQQK